MHCARAAENVKVQLHRARKRLRDEIYARVGTEVDAVFPFHDPRCDRVVAAVFDALQKTEADEKESGFR